MSWFPLAVAGATDAMVTNIPGVCLMVLVADCLPILFYDSKRKVIGIAHVGWRGTVKKIARKICSRHEDAYAINCLFVKPIAMQNVKNLL